MSDVSMKLERFELFSDLPYELREIIWHQCLDDYPARLFHVKALKNSGFLYWRKPAPPPAVLVSRESLAAAEAYYARRGYRGNRGAQALSAAAWFRPERDILYFDNDKWIRLLWPAWLKAVDPDLRAHIRRVGIAHMAMCTTHSTLLTLGDVYRRMPAVDTLYWLVPQYYWANGRSVARRLREPVCCCQRPCALVDVPGSFECLEYIDYGPGAESPEGYLQTRWEFIKPRIEDSIRWMAERGDIPRKPEFKGMFFVRSECPRIGQPGCWLFAPFDATRRAWRAFKRNVPTTKSLEYF